MTFKFVLKCIIREKWLVHNNELVKAVETFSIKISFVYLIYMCVYIYIYIYIYINIYIYIQNIYVGINIYMNKKPVCVCVA